MVINLSKFFFQTQSFFIAGNEKQIIFLLAKTGSKERKSLNLKRSSKTFNQYTKAISNYIYRLYHSVICFYSKLLYYLIPTKRSPWVTVYFESPINYSCNTSTFLFPLPLCYKPLGILQRVIKNK